VIFSIKLNHKNRGITKIPNISSAIAENQKEIVKKDVSIPIITINVADEIS
jgi:hypothetical protein